jgi:DNA ligase 1
VKEGAVRYLTVAEAYRDLEQASGRLALVDRLAVLLARTPAGLLPVICYLCQGLIAPEFAGVDLGLAEKLAVRAVATATGASPAEVTALVRATGDLGLAAEQLLAAPAVGRPASLTVTGGPRWPRRSPSPTGCGSPPRPRPIPRPPACSAP